MNVSDVKVQVREHDRLVALRTQLDAAIAKAQQSDGMVSFELKVTHTENGTGRQTATSAAISINEVEALELLTAERADIASAAQEIESTFSLI